MVGSPLLFGSPLRIKPILQARQVALPETLTPVPAAHGAGRDDIEYSIEFAVDAGTVHHVIFFWKRQHGATIVVLPSSGRPSAAT